MKNYSYYLLIAMSLFFVRCGELETQTELAATNQSSISSPETPLKTRANDTEYFSCFIGFISNEYIKDIIVEYHIEWEGYYNYGTLIPKGTMLLTEKMPERAVECPLSEEIFTTGDYMTIWLSNIHLPELPVEQWAGKFVNLIISQTKNGNANQMEIVYNDKAIINNDNGTARIIPYGSADFYRLPNGTFDGQLGFYYSINIEIPE